MTHREQDQKWSSQYIQHVKYILGAELIENVENTDLDLNQATDLKVLRTEKMTFGMTIRRPDPKTGESLAKKHFGDFTVRSARRSGAKTELDKYLEGMCDIKFYGHAHPTEEGIVEAWMTIDLDAFRAQVGPRVDEFRARQKFNFDGSTAFIAFNVLRDFLPEPRIWVNRHWPDHLRPDPSALAART